MGNINLLSIDSCHEMCSVAVLRCNDAQDFEEIDKSLEACFIKEGAQNMHAEKLVLMIEKALKSMGIWYDSLNSIVVNVGPGSFTGTRIGMSCAKSISISMDSLSLLPVTTMESVAYCIFEKISSSLMGDALIAYSDGMRIVIAIPVADEECYLQDFTIFVNHHGNVSLKSECPPYVGDFSDLSQKKSHVFVCYRCGQSNLMDDPQRGIVVNKHKGNFENQMHIRNLSFSKSPSFFSILLESDAFLGAKFALISMKLDVSKKIAPFPIYLRSRF